MTVRHSTEVREEKIKAEKVIRHDSNNGQAPSTQQAPEPQRQAVDAPFIPSTEWQEVPDWAAVPPGGEYRVDMATGKTHARWDNPPAPDTVVDKRKLPKASVRSAAQDADDDLRKPGSNGAAPDRSDADQTDDQPDLVREAELRFQSYLEDRSLFPKPMRREAFHGIAGKCVDLMAQHCESSPESLLLQFLVIAGNIIGRSVYVYAGGAFLFPNEYVVCVGATARGRKGTAFRMNEHLAKIIAPEWLDTCIASEVQSGEGLVHRIRDEQRSFKKPDRRKKSNNEPPEMIVVDPGITDKRLLTVEEEFSQILKMAQRQGSSLTESYRKAWDSPLKLRTTNKNSPLEASDPHISFIGHTNKEELLQTLTDVDLSNGYANRILWCAANRAKLMPNAEFLDWKKQPEILAELKAVYGQYFANTDEPKRLYRSDEAQRLWTRLYTRLNDEKEILGFIDGVLVRDTSHLLKLALIYAVLDQSEKIEVVHFNAAIAVCDFCQATARWLFGERTGDRLANQIFQALIRAPEGLTRRDISDDVCYRNTPSTKIEVALEVLAKSRLARLSIELGEKSRRIERWHARTDWFQNRVS